MVRAGKAVFLGNCCRPLSTRCCRAAGRTDLGHNGGAAVRAHADADAALLGRAGARRSGQGWRRRREEVLDVVEQVRLGEVAVDEGDLAGKDETAVWKDEAAV